MPKEQKDPRQRPVSCRFCRSRKLRCSRDAQCSNCVSRGLSCELAIVKQLSNVGNAAVSESDAIERIGQLEKLVESLKSQQDKSAEPNPEGSDTQAGRAYTPRWSSPSEHVDNEIAWLESIYDAEDLPDAIPSNRVLFRICSVKSIMMMHPQMSQGNTMVARCIWLPEHLEAKMLLNKFTDDIDYIHHVVHTPSLHSILDGVYACIHRYDQVKSGHGLLLLAIFASSTLSWEQRDCERGLFATPENAHTQPYFWIKAIEDLLDVTHRTTSVSLEGIQGVIIAVFVVANLEGFSRRCRSLWNMALLLGRELELHLIDHPSKSHLAGSAQAEMGRRVWWYLVASDWMMTSSVIPGGYQCHLRQMMVKKPLNINDEDVVDGMSRLDRASSVPTSMSYLLQRIQLAEVSRKLADRAPLIVGSSAEPSHDLVLDIDTELQLLLNDIPPFFSMPLQKLMETYQISLSRATDIVQQGHMVHSFIYARRCELHFPFYTRGFVDPVYALSRDACLQSARLLIQTQVIATPYRFLGLLVGVFMASIVLVADLCHRRSPSHKEQKRNEIAKACHILEGARHESATAAKFLDSLMQVLRKHKMSPPQNPQIETQGHGTRNENCQTAADEAMSDMTTFAMADDGLANGEDLSSYFDDMAQSFEQGGSFDWDNIFSDLSSAFV